MKNILTSILLAFISTLVFSQNTSVQSRLHQLKAQKIAFITQKVNLTANEAQSFWPVYNEFAQKKENINKRLRSISIELKNDLKNLSETQKEKLADKIVASKLEEANLDIEYHEKFKQLLSIDKVLKLYQAENAFKSQLLNQIRNQSMKPKSQRQAKRK